MSRAVVLGGGGGPVGVAREVGLAARLEQAACGSRCGLLRRHVQRFAGRRDVAHGRPTAELLATQHVITAGEAPRGTTDGALSPRCILPNARPCHPDATSRAWPP